MKKSIPKVKKCFFEIFTTDHVEEACRLASKDITKEFGTRSNFLYRENLILNTPDNDNYTPCIALYINN